MAKTVLLVDHDPRSIDAIRRSLATVGVRMLLATDGDLPGFVPASTPAS